MKWASRSLSVLLWCLPTRLYHNGQAFEKSHARAGVREFPATSDGRVQGDAGAFPVLVSCGASPRMSLRWEASYLTVLKKLRLVWSGVCVSH